MIQLVVPPGQSGGVFDFAMKLQNQLGGESAQVIHLAEANAADWKVGPGDVVFLQMSGYGFQKRGVPLWLLRELRARRMDIATLGIFFHELYAFGPPWTSSFWLSPVQRHIAWQLAGICDFWMTSREASAAWLRRHAAGTPHHVLPVFSNVGETAAYRRSRAPRIAIFGSPGMRHRAYRAGGQALFDWARRAALELHDIGLPLTDGKLTHALRAQGAILHGRLDEGQVSGLLAESAFGIAAYPIDYAAKSSIFAAYCAHGVCPVLLSESYAPADGLSPGVQYIAGIPGEEIGLDSVHRVGEAAWNWYQPHRLQNHGEALRRFARIGEE
jgi:hypothetical protein